MPQSNVWCCVLCYELVSFIIYGMVVGLGGLYCLYWFRQYIDRQYLQLLSRNAEKMPIDPPEPEDPSDPDMKQPSAESESQAQGENHTAEAGEAAAAAAAAATAEEEEENVYPKVDSVDAEFSYDGTWSCGDSLQVFKLQETKQ